MTVTGEFYFDFVSPYAYLAWRRLDQLCEEHNLRLEPRPVLLAGILGHWGQLGPAEIPAKRRFFIKDVLRWAAEYEFTMRFPDPHPFNPLGALRVTLAAGSHMALQNEIIDALFTTAWRNGRHLSDAAVLKDILDETVDLDDDLVARSQSPPIKEALREQTDEAIERGVFGVPTIRVDGELFWGNDRLGHLERFLEGNDDWDRDAYREALSSDGVTR
jgi:2-hydroxychromene-2-carboxylate isomerase